jgi:DNA polymerase-3 subunit epsilon
MAGFDLETTGIDPEQDRIVTACVVYVSARRTLEPHNWISDPGIDIPAGAAAIHGISTERARAEGRPAANVINEVVNALANAVADGTPIVAMNASFDLTMLDREARRHGLQPLTDLVGNKLRVIDPRVLDKHFDPRRPGKRTLTDLCRHYQVPLDSAHSADADAVAACHVAWRIGTTSRVIGAMPLADLHDQQVIWARQQAESLADYFRRTPGKEHQAAGVRGDWPLIPHQRATAAQAEEHAS